MEPVTLDDPYYHKHPPYRAKIQSFAEQCSGRVLDLGCGSKPYREWFDINDGEYIGVDISSNDDVNATADALQLPFKSGSFDYVMSNQVLEHVPDPFQFFEEVARVLKPGGGALITTNQSFYLHGVPNDYFRYTRYGLSELADRAGLEKIDIVFIRNSCSLLESKVDRERCRLLWSTRPMSQRTGC